MCSGHCGQCAMTSVRTERMGNMVKTAQMATAAMKTQIAKTQGAMKHTGTDEVNGDDEEGTSQS